MLLSNQGSCDRPYLWFWCVDWGFLYLVKIWLLIFDSFRPSNLLVFFCKSFTKIFGKWGSMNSAFFRSHDKVFFWRGRRFGATTFHYRYYWSSVRRVENYDSIRQGAVFGTLIQIRPTKGSRGCIFVSLSIRFCKNLRWLFFSGCVGFLSTFLRTLNFFFMIWQIVIHFIFGGRGSWMLWNNFWMWGTFYFGLELVI